MTLGTLKLVIIVKISPQDSEKNQMREADRTDRKQADTATVDHVSQVRQARTSDRPAADVEVPRTKPLHLVTALDVPPGLDPEDVASDY